MTYEVEHVFDEVGDTESVENLPRLCEAQQTRISELSCEVECLQWEHGAIQRLVINVALLSGGVMGLAGYLLRGWL